MKDWKIKIKINGDDKTIMRFQYLKYRRKGLSFRQGAVTPGNPKGSFLVQGRTKQPFKIDQIHRRTSTRFHFFQLLSLRIERQRR